MTNHVRASYQRTSTDVSAQLARIDRDISSVEFWPHPDYPSPIAAPTMQPEPDLRLVAALARAARAAASCATSEATMSLPLDLRKKRVDSEATRAGEKILSASTIRLTVSAGEGERDDSSGATLGQTFGPEIQGTFAVIDYVDGTGLVAEREPGALALGALARTATWLPDVKVFTTLVPRERLAEVDMSRTPAVAAASALEALSAARNKSPRELKILTHTRDVGRPQDPWYDFLRSKVGEVLIPGRIAVEPPYFLSLAASSNPRIDGMIGVMGLVELAYAALMLDALHSNHAFKFRMVSATTGKHLLGDPPEAFQLSARDLAAADTAGFSALEEHTSDELMAPSSCVIAAMAAITPNQLLRLPAATETEVSGLVVADGVISGYTINYGR